MKIRVTALVIVVLCAAAPAFAHRLDEYLQATTFDLRSDRVEVQMRLTPGVEVLGKVLAAMGATGDGDVSQANQRAYADRVRRDVSLTLDGKPAPLRLISLTFPSAVEMHEGLGEILLDFQADLPAGGPDRKLTFQNHHLPAISVYMANCLAPTDPAIGVADQNRNYTQSFYELDYTQGTHPATAVAPAAAGWRQRVRDWLDRSGSVSLFEAFFYHGVHHILTGYDHLLFVSALVLAATTLWNLVKVVSAFTLAHTITLTLAAFNLVHLPERVVEPLISASIVFVAIQNVFWPSLAGGWSRLGAAFFFGLFHGLGFAGGLLDAMQQMQCSAMLLALLAFSIGVEAGHQMVVLPLFACLKTLRRTRPDPVLRTRLSMRLQRIGSMGISVAGMYYLCLALAGYG